MPAQADENAENEESDDQPSKKRDAKAESKRDMHIERMLEQ